MRKKCIIAVILLFLVSLFGCVTNDVQENEVDVQGQSFNIIDKPESVFVDEIPLLDQCNDLCGDGYCNEFRDKNSTNSREASCPENEKTCPEDC